MQMNGNFRSDRLERKLSGVPPMVVHLFREISVSFALPSASQSVEPIFLARHFLNV